MSLRDAGPHLSQLNIAVLGISPDSPSSQKNFAEKNRLDFPLLSDENHKVAKQYGAWGEKKMYGKTMEGIIRSSFLIDGTGKIVSVWYRISPQDTVPEALKILEAKN